MKSEYSRVFGGIYHCPNCDGAYMRDSMVEVFPDYKKCPKCKHRMSLRPHPDLEYVYRCGWCNESFYVRGGQIYPDSPYKVKTMGTNMLINSLMLILMIIVIIVLVAYLAYAFFFANSVISYTVLAIIGVVFLIFLAIYKITDR